LLIVQDDHAFASATAKIAEELGYETLTIHSSTDFYQAYSLIRPAVIVMELLMQEVDGIEMVRWLIKQNNRAAVIMTVKSKPLLAEAAVALVKHANLFNITVLHQPLNSDDIREILIPD